MTLNDRVLGVGALVLAALITAFGYDLEPLFPMSPSGPKPFPCCWR